MVRRSRIVVEGGNYHVYNRVCCGEHIFADPEEAMEFINRVCELAGFNPIQLASRARDQGTADARKVVATLGVERWSQKRTALAAALNKNPDVVSFWAGEGTRRRQEDPNSAEMLDDFDERLSASLTTNS